MTVIGYHEDSSAGLILRHLQRNGQATVKELERVLGVSKTAVREHLANLVAESLIRPQTVRRGPGRPHFVYQLTEKAQTLFPKQYDLLINLLLQELLASEGREKVDQLFARVSQRMVAEYADRLSAEALQDRLAEMRELLAAQGIPTEIRPDGERIEFYACPYFDVAQEHPQICAMERQMLEGVLGGKVALERSIREGHHNCCFVVQTAEEK
jgi:DeoR family transcriptional regulator, suf operon transcriptional repressor